MREQRYAQAPAVRRICLGVLYFVRFRMTRLKFPADPVWNLQGDTASLGEFGERFQGKGTGRIPGSGDQERQRNEFAKMPGKRNWKVRRQWKNIHVEVAPCNVVVGINIVHEVIEAGEA